MDTLPEVSFICTPATEVRRLAYTAAQIANGFYQRHQFLIQSELGDADRAGVVIFPDLSLSPAEWQMLAQFSLEFKAPITQSLSQLLLGRISSLNLVDETKLCDLAATWTQQAAQFWEFIRLVLPQMVGCVKQVEVRVTNFGSVASYSTLTEEENQTLILYLRQDAPLCHLAEVLLSALLMPTSEAMGLDWSEAEAVVDVWLTQSVLAPIFPGYSPTLLGTRHTTIKQRQETIAYLCALGVPEFKAPVLEITNGQLYLDHQACHQFTVHESKLLLALVTQPARILTYDELGAVLWHNDEDQFSLWAVNRTVSRLRCKLAAMGLPRDVIKSKYGVGYWYQVD